MSTTPVAQGHVDVNVSRCVVRVKTTVWADKRGLHTKKSLTFLRRQCEGFNVLEEDAGAIGAEEVLHRVLNLDEVEDGIYDVVVCDEKRDWEGGYVDDYDYRLVTTNVGGPVDREVMPLVTTEKDMDKKRQAAGQKLLDAANEFWSACHEEGQCGAVQWLTGTLGELVIFTRGEYRERLMANIQTLPSVEKIHMFGEEMPNEDDEA